MRTTVTLFVLCLGVLLVVPMPGRAQVQPVPECGVDIPITHPYCEMLCETEDPRPAFCPPLLERDPVILIPGITVSQNKKLLYKDQDGGSWRFAFGFNVYKGLINKLEQAGYALDEDLFVAHYDWRRGAEHNVTEYLVPMLEHAKQATGATKLDVIGHSFGGLIARSYIQSDSYASDIDQLITLGTPHQGAADAYVAWEGGIYPAGWDFFIKRRIGEIEEALKESRNQLTLSRPESFRSFFPSLRDLLPITDFVKKNDELVPVDSLAEQNSFLHNLSSGLSSIVAKGVQLATIAGTSEATLDKIALSNERSPEDELLNRWRDGEANPLPPPLDSTTGDARVIVSSAHVGSQNITLNNAQHHTLPDAAQDQIFEILGLEPQPSFFSNFSDRLFGVTILSPLDVVIEGPGGKILSKDHNDFGEDVAEFDDDPLDPDDPKVITFADPPPGDYIFSYTGTGNGEYTIIKTYADENETISSTEEGTTTPGATLTEVVGLTAETSTLVDDGDYHELLENLLTNIQEAKKGNVLKTHEYGTFLALATAARVNLRLYEELLERGREPLALSRLRAYRNNLQKLKEEVQHMNTSEGSRRADFKQDNLQLIDKILLHSPLM